ncbi:lysophospholipid acyltransferase family protein [Salsipaludibacter albus]|uniref:lysophospholipid acyltransferase family protein n=1 Tax=Salsipaludibacter albus TaxID=2849650 RepID=UPI001EE42C52|nr:lysophospholipid acyltransferase family protein [Salsipaludibacter albus]MBY5164244.1 1-acyl-sn-glycerol-3-phosphate acyltransferase [Salsipaludibacter albus]
MAGEPTGPRASLLYRTAAGAALGLFALQRWDLRTTGLDNVPRTGGVVVAANHMSFWDFFLVGAGPYRAWGRPARILAKQSLFDTPVFGPIMRSAGHIPVRRGRGRAAYTDAVAALGRGELVMVLPEATISPALDLLDFRAGAARMAIAAGVPLVPAISWGSHRFHTVKHGPTPRWRLPVTVDYGEPLHPGPDDDPREVTAELHARMQVMFDAAVRDYPDGTPAGAWWVPARFGGGAPTPEQADAYLDGIRRAWR